MRWRQVLGGCQGANIIVINKLHVSFGQELTARATVRLTSVVIIAKVIIVAKVVIEAQVVIVAKVVFVAKVVIVAKVVVLKVRYHG